MSNYLRQRQLRARKPAAQTRNESRHEDSEPRLPHEHDESSDSQAGGPREVMERARRDVEEGQQDTDLRGTPGLEKPEKRGSR
ncbi:MAG TPA: hypothetical protein VH105_12745 [Burkholderiales bacterium]|jgi:hypothetical protein|nr:hypothetical protein [Burkholderiales bacterium]